jgi:hypothetical protein
LRPWLYESGAKRRESYDLWCSTAGEVVAA